MLEISRVMLLFYLIFLTPIILLKEQSQKFQMNVKKLANALGSKRNGPKTPALIQVLPINEKSEIERPICEYKLSVKNYLEEKEQLW